MLIQSSYWKKGIEVNTYETENGHNAISHDALENIIFNDEEAVKREVGAEFSVWSADPNHSVVKCIICDNAGRRIEAIGETTASSLETDISKMYPTLMAQQRAFDRAAIRYLNFPGKIYATTEGIPLVDNGQNRTEDVTPTAPSWNASNDFTPAPISSVQEHEAKTQDVPVQNAPLQQPNSLGDELFIFGKFKGQTIRSVYDNHPEYFDWMFEKYTPFGNESKLFVEKCRQFVASVKA